ncbi:YoaK family protein [Gordonia sp. DT219]|uniref:YoaK family protein n=1 Tax=Gordonia sp. DT219 TaxID=3416658 RepID=UPI003CFAEE98
MSTQLAADTRATYRPQTAMLALTFSTGIIDAVGYLHLDRVFTGNMTGNVVMLGMGLAGVDDLPILAPVLALTGFLCGAALGGRTLRGRASGWASATAGLLSAVAALLVVVAVVLAVDDHPAREVALAITMLLGISMGIQAAAARRVGVTDVSTVVVTSTITALGMDSWFGSQVKGHTARRVLAVILISAGAATGAFLLKWHPSAAVGVAAVVTICVVIGGHRR